MAHHDNLNRIAQEFAMIDEAQRRIRRAERQAHDNPVRRSYDPPKIIDSKEAAKKYGGVVEVITGRRPAVHQVKPVSAAKEKLSCYEGGVLIMDYSKRKYRAMAY